ncbi:MAG TPA: tRNA preQ1(34) S-adenosylmethionine ribosyltransferase-isomerase QueA [Hyphomicrobiales bacterium]|nr:tRNA preQ1(34) S-adenosylmethionine ribosyltransferase-isomerase QueA [Hyphomicrobiales bacterium]
MRVDDFDFELPEERIALRPAEPRESARLLCVTPGADPELADRTIGDLPALLRPGDVLVFNDTRVIPAQLFGVRQSEGSDDAVIGVTLHKRLSGNEWLAFAKPGRKLSVGGWIEFAGIMRGQVLEKREGGEIRIAFETDGRPVMECLAEIGVMPLPPYIAARRKADERDASDYQTSFASEPGAVAAPTAGLHFTDDLIAKLKAAGIETAFLTLHVGAGTFLPVKADDTAEHKMHAEWGEIDANTASRLTRARREGRRIVATGTTSLRLIESAATKTGEIRPFSGDTDIFITPGYRFRATDLLVTNFHLPKSTLFMLVAAFSGLDRMKRAYAHAIEAGYRFYSYGDACLLSPATASIQTETTAGVW